MAVVIFVSGLALLGLPGFGRRVGRQIDPESWSRICANAIVGGAALVEVAALLLAAPTVLGFLGVHGVAAACHRLLGPLAPGSPLAGWLAAAGAIALPATVGRRLTIIRRRRRQMIVDPALGEHRAWGSHDLMVLATDEVLAFSNGGRHSQIVVSRGLEEALSPTELRVVLRHEAAHLEHRHQRFLLVAAALDTQSLVLAPLRRSTRCLRTGLERWADEVAVGGDSRARQDLHRALVGITTDALSAGVTPLSASDTIAERLHALEGGPGRSSVVSHATMAMVGTFLALVGLSALGLLFGDAHVLVAMAGRCPI